MALPGFTAETSLFETDNHYRSGGNFSNNLHTTVTPQDCGYFEFFTCFLYVTVSASVCGLACGACIASGFDPLPCAAAAGCVLGLGSLDAYIPCHDCFPPFITEAVDSTLRGGGGPPPPDCTTTGCRPGFVCCECVSPAPCTTQERCNQLCQL